MTETVRLGTIAGVRVGAHWSVLGIVILLVVGLSSVWLPGQFPGRSLGAYVVAALVASVLFVASLLAHEVSHAVVATRNGMPVKGITLWLLGGIAWLRGDAKTPGVDFRIAAVGPATSLVLGLGFGVLSWAMNVLTAWELATGVVSYLALTNVLLALFNLVPAAPLDGGRILRAALWAWRGDRTQAQIWSARAGRVFGFVLIALGLLSLLAGDAGGLWWIFIGLFIVNIAMAEEQQVRMGAALGGLSVGDLMTPHPVAADGGQTVEDFIRQVALTHRHSAFPLVGASGELQGLVTLNRVRQVPPQQRPTSTLAQIACPAEEVPTATPGEPLNDLLPRMDGCTDGRAVVLDEGRVIGIISPSDISRAVVLRGLDVAAFGGADLVRTR